MFNVLYYCQQSVRPDDSLSDTNIGIGLQSLLTEGPGLGGPSHQPGNSCYRLLSTAQFKSRVRKIGKITIFSIRSYLYWVGHSLRGWLVPSPLVVITPNLPNLYLKDLSPVLSSTKYRDKLSDR